MSYIDIISSQRLLYPNLWELRLDPSSNSNLIINVISNTALKFLCKSVSFPPFTNFELENRISGSNHFLKKDNPKEITFTFYEDHNKNVMNLYNNWINAFYDYEKKVWKSGINPYLQATISLTTFNNVGGEEDNGSWILENLIPQSFDQVTLDYENADTLELSLTLGVENIKQDL